MARSLDLTMRDKPFTRPTIVAAVERFDLQQLVPQQIKVAIHDVPFANWS